MLVAFQSKLSNVCTELPDEESFFWEKSQYGAKKPRKNPRVVVLFLLKLEILIFAEHALMTGKYCATTQNKCIIQIMDSVYNWTLIFTVESLH